MGSIIITYARWALYITLLFFTHASANPLPNFTETSLSTSPVNGTPAFNLTDPFDPARKDLFVLNQCVAPPGPLWLLPDFVYQSLTFISQRWRHPEAYTSRGIYADPDFPWRRIVWATRKLIPGSELFLCSNLGWIASIALTSVLRTLDPNALFVESSRFYVRFKGDQGSEGTFAWENYSRVGAGNSSFQGDRVDSVSEETLSRRHVEGNTTAPRESLGDDTLDIQLSIKPRSPAVKASQLHFFQAIQTAIHNVALYQRPADTLASKVISTMRNTVFVTSGSVKLIVVIEVPQPTEVPATFQDLEYALRQLVIAPELAHDPQLFEGTANMISRGGTGRAFARFLLVPATRIDPVAEGGGVSVENAWMVLDERDLVGGGGNGTVVGGGSGSCPA